MSQFFQGDVSSAGFGVYMQHYFLDEHNAWLLARYGKAIENQNQMVVYQRYMKDLRTYCMLMRIEYPEILDPSQAPEDANPEMTWSLFFESLEEEPIAFDVWVEFLKADAEEIHAGNDSIWEELFIRYLNEKMSTALYESERLLINFGHIFNLRV